MRTFLQQMAVGMKGLVRQVLATAVIFCCAFSAADSAAASGITSMRIGQGVGSVRIVFDADRKFDYKVFLLNEPKRLVIDTFDVKVSPEIEKYVDKNNLVTKTRLGSVGTDGIRIVFDLQKPAIVKKAFMLAPQSNFGWRFVIDVSIASEREFSSKVGSKYALSNENSFAGSYSSSSSKSSSKAKTVNKKKIIVLDPGHGGKDPGAIGYSGVYEKNITLAMAKELKVILEKEGYKVHLTRSTDIFIPLRDRVKIARKYNLVTNFGKFMDPLADKLLVCSAMICLVDLRLLPSWIVIIIIAREFIISGFRLIAAEHQIVIAASMWGKFKTTFQMAMIILIILNINVDFYIAGVGVIHVLATIATYVALVLTIVSLIDYLNKNKAVLKEQD